MLGLGRVGTGEGVGFSNGYGGLVGFGLVFSDGLDGNLGLEGRGSFSRVGRGVCGGSGGGDNPITILS